MRISLNEALCIIKNNVSKINSTEKISIKNANGRITAKQINSNINVPPFDRSPLDGYALIAEGIAKVPVQLEVIEEVYAGKYPKKVVQKGQATRIMTGAPIPKGANCVVRQEHTDYGIKKVTINNTVKHNQNICYAGEDIKFGEVVVDEGTKLNYIHRGVLASIGVFDIEVYKIPKILLLLSGDEVIENGALSYGKIYDSNSHIISGRFEELGIKDIDVIYSDDNKESIKKIISTEINNYDLIITTGGVSVGAKDFMPIVIDELKADKKFHGLDLKPGSPAMFSIYNGKPILSLSGNPFASLVTFELLAKPIINIFIYGEINNSNRYTSIMGDNWSKSSDVQRYVRAIEKNGKVYLPKNHSSGSLASMKDCNCLIVIEKGNTGILIGETVNIIKIN